MSKRKYTKEFNQKVLKEQSIAVKYGIHAESTVLKCARQYNSHEELTGSRKARTHPKTKDIKRRKTMVEERLRIVEYCISHCNGHASDAKEFGCSYGQVKNLTDGCSNRHKYTIMQESGVSVIVCKICSLSFMQEQISML